MNGTPLFQMRVNAANNLEFRMIDEHGEVVAGGEITPAAAEKLGEQFLALAKDARLRAQAALN